MSDTDRCCYCSRLPQRRLGHACRVQRCPLCKNEVGVAGSGESFRIAAAGPRSSRRWLIAAAGALGIVLVAIAVRFASSERPVPVVTPVATVVAEAPAPIVRVAEPPQPILAVVKRHGWADPLVRVKPNGELARSAAKPNDSAIRIVRLANVKRSSRIPRTVAKRSNEAPPEVAFPAWLRRSPASLEPATLRDIREVGLERLKTRTELLDAFKDVTKKHGEGSDKFLDALVKERTELAGLPYLKGNACKLNDSQAQSLGRFSTLLRGLLDGDATGFSRGQSASADHPKPSPAVLENLFPQLPVRPKSFRPQSQSTSMPEPQVSYAASTLPALMQILAVQPPEFRVELVNQLRKLPDDDDATIAALVRLALFDPAADVRAAAVDALRQESFEKYGPKLLEGFRYPMAAVAEHAADAIVALDRRELLPALVGLLDERDPNAPFAIEEAGEKRMAVREVVKINHHRNCMLCHAPIVDDKDVRRLTGLAALVPLPDAPLPPSTSRVYYATRQGLPAIRANETYLRQDFSVMEAVENHGSWPTMQRFDFLVRTRTLTPEQAHHAESASRSPEIPCPNHRAVLQALTRMTSNYAGGSSADWRAELERRRALEELEEDAEQQ